MEMKGSGQRCDRRQHDFADRYLLRCCRAQESDVDVTVARAEGEPDGEWGGVAVVEEEKERAEGGTWI